MPATFTYTPLGTLQLIASEEALLKINFSHQFIKDDSLSNDITRLAVMQLREYFDGERQLFELPLQPKGTEFQLKIWELLQTIPFGKTINYKELAQMYGDAGALRAAGTANGKNPLPIIIPCHRVIGADGNLTGYSGGLDKKEKLLKLEGVRLQGSLF
jgi:methylated-DNA-[protein]-cysteine S-methyltransferase